VCRDFDPAVTAVDVNAMSVLRRHPDRRVCIAAETGRAHKAGAARRKSTPELPGARPA